MLPERSSGVVLGERFALEARVGEGGMAAIYRARDQLTGSVVAVKLLHANARSAYIQEHFIREAEILASLHHPHIVSYIAHGHAQDGAAYLAVEWLDGEDLAQRLTRGPLPLSETLQLATILADALKMTHARGVIHRDLKPSTIAAGGMGASYFPASSPTAEKYDSWDAMGRFRREGVRVAL